jgi:hypothetical protein
MLVVDLACPNGHRFEGWFASADDLNSQRERGLLSCPVCGDVQVQRVPSATRLNVGAHAEPQAASPSQARGREVAPVPAGVPSPMAARADDKKADVVEALQAMYWSAVRHVMAHTEDVGERFADDARAMHAGELPAKPIRGQLDQDEREALKEEGIEVLTLAVPKDFDGTVQ